MSEDNCPKHFIKYGILCRVAAPDKPWSLVHRARFIFDTEIEAYAAANKLNISQTTQQGYHYKPIEIEVVVDIHKALENHE